MPLNLFAITVQAVGTLLVAALLWQLTRLMPGRFLRYWSIAWVALTVALFSLRLMFGWNNPFALMIYAGGEYLFGFLMWAGFQDYAGQGPNRRTFWVLVPLGGYAVALSLWHQSISRMFPFHAPILGVFFALSLWSTRGICTAPGRPPVGLTIVRIMLGGLAIVFLHYGPVILLTANPDDHSAILPYLTLSPVYDALLELGLAFGMMVLAAERAQDELAEKNRQLAAATAQLAEAARTDVLTGLFNRRGFEEMLTVELANVTGAVAVLDLNDLKPLNDRYGHAAGDAAWPYPIFRMGGDEFLVILVGGSAADLSDRLAQLDVALVGQRLPGVPTPVNLMAAWGVAAFVPGGLADAVSNADAAMYARKSSRKSIDASAVKT
jgi:GGDEF domain-containing protein